MPLSIKEIEQLKHWFAEHNVPLEIELIEKFELYHDLILSWSSRMNLVSKGDLRHLLEYHILDSLIPLSEIPNGAKILDIGSGGGFPAIPLALVSPDSHFTLLESIHKKILFLRVVIEKLNLKNMIINEARLEETESLPIYDIITVRALPRWENFLEKIKNFLNSRGRIIYFEKRGIYRVITKQ